jgi:hypothetical protein
MKQSSLRPHDVAVALQIAISPQAPYAGLAADVGISASEAHESVRRLRLAKLIGAQAFRRVRKRSLEEFLVIGVQYAFPAELGMVTRGVPTAHSGPKLNSHFASSSEGSAVEDVLVWPHEDGGVRGVSVTPLYAGAPRTAKNNPALYELLTLVDALRIGQARERRLAKAMLTHALNVEYA